MPNNQNLIKTKRKCDFILIHMIFSQEKMAEAGIQRSTILCRYFLSGVCKDGEKCPFSHDRTCGVPDTICRYYMKGVCTYGSQCRYDHIKPNRSIGNKKANEKLTGSSQTVARKPLSIYEANAIKPNVSNKTKLGPPKQLDNWVNAPEFIPKSFVPKSYAQATCSSKCISNDISHAPCCSKKLSLVDCEVPTPDACNVSEPRSLCPYFYSGTCHFPADKCIYIHGDICSMCGYACLHPTDTEQRKQHEEECLRAHEKDMELSFAVARSKDKTCGICMEVVLEKNPASERRFGLLENCTHVFCLSCIRKWRQARQFETKIIRSCPECRVTSDFITPSKYWIETKEDKLKLIEQYKTALSTKACKYFKAGEGECPFGSKCFYSHVYPDGRKADLAPPQRRRRQNSQGNMDIMERLLLWDWLEERESRWMLQFDLEDVLDFLTDSETDSNGDFSVNFSELEDD